MGRFPIATSQGGITTQAPGSILPLDAYSQGLKNVEQTGNTAVQLSEQFQQAKDVTDNLTAKNRLMKEAQAILTEAENFNDYQTGPDIDEKSKQLNDRLNRIMPDIMQGFTNKQNAERFQPMAEFFLDQNGAKLQHTMRGKTEDLFKSNFIIAQEAGLNAYITTGDTSYKDEMIIDINEAVAGGLINREMGTKLTQEIKNEWEVKYIENLANIDPDGTIAKLKAGEFTIQESQIAPLEKRIKEIKTNNHALNERLKDQQQDAILEGFYNNIEKKISQGLPLNYDDIPQGLNGKNTLNLKKYVDDVNKKGDADTNIQTWQYLYDLQTTNPQEFLNTNLAQWRASLSDKDYKAMLKAQTDMKNFVPTELAEDKKLFEEAAKNANVKVGIKDQETKALQAALPQYLREIENGLKRPLKPWEREKFVKEFADTMEFTNKEHKEKAIRAVMDGMNQEAFYMKKLVGDFQTFERNNGRAPNTEEKYKIIQQRAGKETIEQNTQVRDAVNFVSMYGNRISSQFGQRTAPTAGASTSHQGVDVKGKMNEPFISPVSGRVQNVGFDKGLGNFVDVVGSDGATWRFAHAEKINVKTGQQIKTGDLLLSVGSTGISTGPHTHVEKIVNGQRVNPMQSTTQVAQQPKPAVQRGYAEGTVIVNNSGKRMVMRGGTWQQI